MNGGTALRAEGATIRFALSSMISNLAYRRRPATAPLPPYLSSLSAVSPFRNQT